MLDLITVSSRVTEKYLLTSTLPIYLRRTRRRKTANTISASLSLFFSFSTRRSTGSTRHGSCRAGFSRNPTFALILPYTGRHSFYLGLLSGLPDLQTVPQWSPLSRAGGN